MHEFITYSATSILLSGGFYALFRTFLQGERAFGFNRKLLMALVALSLALPALGFTKIFTVKETPLPAPRENVTALVGREVGEVLYVEDDKPDLDKAREEISESQPPVILTKPVDEIRNTNKEVIEEKEFPYGTIALTIYLIGFAAFTLKFLIGLRGIRKLGKLGVEAEYGNYKLCVLNDTIAPFSFWRTIYIPGGVYSEEEFNQIILHERAHIEQRHSVDIIFFEMACALAWFNPFLRLFKKSAIELHEYLADSATLSAGVSKIDYSSTLYKNLTGEKLFASSHYLNKDQVKRRLKMMSKAANSKFSALKYSLVIPAVALISLVFSCSQEAAISDSDYKDMRISLKYQKLHSRDENGFVVEYPGGEKALKNYMMKCEDLRKLYEKKNKFVQLFCYFKIDKKGTPQKSTIGVSVGDYGAGVKTAQLSDRVRKYLENMPSLKVLKVNNPTANYANMEMRVNFGDFENNAYQFAFSEPKREVKAEFPGGKAELENFVKKNLRIPAEAQSRGLNAKLHVYFFVEPDGRITNPVVSSYKIGDENWNEGNLYGCKEEAERLIKSMPRWKPAIENGKPIRSHGNVQLFFGDEQKWNDQNQPTFAMSFLNPRELKIVPKGLKPLSEQELKAETDSVVQIPYKVMDFVEKNVKYPKSQIKSNISGSVLASVVINKKGEITTPKVERGINKAFDDETMRVLRMLKPVRPILDKYGRPIEMKATINVKYKL